MIARPPEAWAHRNVRLISCQKFVLARNNALYATVLPRNQRVQHREETKHSITEGYS